MGVASDRVCTAGAEGKSARPIVLTPFGVSWQNLPYCRTELSSVIPNSGASMWEPSRAERVNHSVAALRALLEPGELSAIVLTTPGSVSWATGGMNPSIDRTAATDVIWVCVTPDTVAILTTEVEAPRIAARFRMAPSATK